MFCQFTPNFRYLIKEWHYYLIMVEDISKEEKSSYNEAQFQIMRLHELALSINHLIGAGKLNDLKFKLDVYWAELKPSLKKAVSPKEGTGIIKENDIKRNKIANAKTHQDLYDSLYDRLLFLREVQEDVGKGGVYKDPDLNKFD